MAVIDDFVFLFKTEGQDEIKKNLSDVLSMVKDLVKAEAEEELASKKRIQASKEASIQRRQQAAEERSIANAEIRDKRSKATAERRAEAISKGIEERQAEQTRRQQVRTTGVQAIQDVKLKQALGRAESIDLMKQKNQIRLQIEQNKLQQQMAKMSKDNLETEKKKTREHKRQNSELGSMIGKFLTVAALMKLATGVAQTSGVIQSYNLQGDITQLRPSDIKAFGIATKRFGGTEEGGRSALSNIVGQLESARIGQNNELFTKLGMAGIQLDESDLKDVWSFMSAISRGMQEWKNPESIRTGMNLLSGIFDAPTLNMMKQGFDVQIESARKLIQVKPEEVKAVEELNKMWQDTTTSFNEGMQQLTVGFAEWLPEIKNFKTALSDVTPLMKSLGQAIGYIVFGPSMLLNKLSKVTTDFARRTGIVEKNANMWQSIDKGVSSFIGGVANFFTGNWGTSVENAREKYPERFGRTIKKDMSFKDFITDNIYEVPEIPNVSSLLHEMGMRGYPAEQGTGGTINLETNNNIYVNSVEEANRYDSDSKMSDMRVGRTIAEKNNFAMPRSNYGNAY